MATPIKTAAKTLTEAEWKSLKLRFNRGDMQGALGAAAQRARQSGEAWYVYANCYGYQVQHEEPAVAKGNRYWRIVVVGGSIRGELYEL